MQLLKFEGRAQTDYLGNLGPFAILLKDDVRIRVGAGSNNAVVVILRPFIRLTVAES